ncbi:alpha/beta fold hydrolase [Solimonas soli]|uniref:alpha/beta fold hydrolase n=1 Tax=Solimonas soli TaxID=413479 RepID=UPI0004B2D511|nr:alpha/beta hydrolase [Solimonas soli]
MELIGVPGAQLATLALGARSAPPLVMLHGLVSGNMASWYSSLASPLSASRRVILYDQRGHGASSLPRDGFDLDRQADDLGRVLAHHGQADAGVDIVGHSMGALIALRYALRRPRAVRRLVLVDAPMPAREHVAPSFAGLRTADDLGAWLDQQFAGLGGRRRERQQQRLQALFFASTLRADVQAMDAEPDAALAALKLPVLLVYGRASPCRAAGERLAAVLPQAALEWLDCGHYIPEEAPQALLAALTRFLTDDMHAHDLRETA